MVNCPLNRSVLGWCPMATKRPWQGYSVTSPVLTFLSFRPVTPPWRIAQHLLHHRVPDEGHLGVGLGPLLHDLGGAQLVAAVDQRDLAPEPGEVDRLLQRRVAAADHGDLLAPEEEPVAGGAGRDAVTHQAALRLQAEVLGRGAGGDDDGAGAMLLPRVVHQPEGPPGEVGFHDPPLKAARAEALGLLAEEVHQLRTLDAVGEAGVVLHLGGDGQLSAGLDAFEDQGIEVRPRGVDRRREARRPGADDDDIFRGRLAHGSLLNKINGQHRSNRTPNVQRRTLN